jgi:preprotein translocase subunit YajC
MMLNKNQFMKKTILVMATAISFFACTNPEATTSTNSDEAMMADFKENSKVTTAVFEAFANKDLQTWASYISDTLKANGAGYGLEATIGKEELMKRLAGLHSIVNNIKANDIQLYPGLDSVTYKLNSDVRAYVRWTDDGINGAKIEHKYYGIFRFNKDHKIIETDEFMDISGVIKAATEPKK